MNPTQYGYILVGAALLAVVYDDYIRPHITWGIKQKRRKR